jgi:hypothetical protein
VHYSSCLYNPVELTFQSARAHADPFNDVELDVEVAPPSGQRLTIPAFWSGGQTWRARFAGHEIGLHRWRTVCSDEHDGGLHGIEGAVDVSPYEGENPLYRRGPLRIAANGRYLEHRDGTPFFWLADTWWLGLCRRLSWPDEFQLLTDDRVEKGFTVAQIVAGLYPDMDAFDPRGANEAGYPWEPHFARINPAYFDMADRRLQWLVDSGLVPCIVGAWGYYIDRLGVERMKRHWRYLVARYAGYPVVWCLAGEVLMPYYLERFPSHEARESHIHGMAEQWNEVAAYVRAIDPYHHPVTVHPCGGCAARDMISDDLLDFDMLQTGHSDRASLPTTVDCAVSSYARIPTKPVINAEVCYEGIGEACRQEVQRLMFWVSVLSGAAGHTYGANGIWQLNRRDAPYGPSPHGMSWGDAPWEDAYRLPGARQLALAKALLLRYRWWEFEPHPEWVEPRWTKGNYALPYAAGIPARVRIIFTPAFNPIAAVRDLEPGVSYCGFYWDPATGTEHEIGEATPDADGLWEPPPLPVFQDWVLVLEAHPA